jgi:hypothetical protein
LAEVAYVSYVGNVQHNGEGAPLHWDRSKSSDEADAAIRHFLERGKIDSDGTRHTAKAAWRLLALLEKELEAAELPKVDLSMVGPYVNDGSAVLRTNMSSDKLCHLHGVFLDFNDVCPSDPSSVDHHWWLANHAVAFAAKQAAQ